MNNQQPGQHLNRRTILGGGTALAGAGLAGILAGCTPANPRPSSSSSLASAAPSAPLKEPHVVLLGINGGPGWYPKVQPAGISTAIVVGDATYVVDVGDRAPDQYMIANPNGNKEYEEFSTLRGLFLTHLHSDHTIEYFKMFNYGWWNGLNLVKDPVKVMGPGRRKTLPPAFDEDKVPEPASPKNPMPGTVDMTNSVFDAYATDINDRVRDNGFINLRDLVDVEDIKIPGYEVGLETKKHMPEMDPFDIYEDDRVKVSAILVDHYPVFPAFAFRFDTDGGSVVISGDTGPTPNIGKIAQGADMLLHEVIDDEWVDTVYKDDPGIRQHLFAAHTSASTLGKIAEDAGVGQLVLTHLVPSEPPLSRFDAASKGFSGKFHVGKDLDRLPLKAR
ncbi:MBL fold metallo-hydrolase [Arthrobacter sp. JSM 101049]|uniref:MBL fold metallo-hydrolase n=1 Tax=Arthrobacter sp. JSM 101049 TaxID=929097 RepID=UPI003568AC9A